MLTYILTFNIFVFAAFIINAFRFKSDVKFLATFFIFVYLILFVGLRHEVGGDWDLYLYHFEILENFSLDNLYNQNPGYIFFEYISKFFGLGIYGVNLLCAIIFMISFLYFVNYFKINLSYALIIAFPYLIMVVINGYSRQGVALGLTLLSIAFLHKTELLKSFFFLALATMFHETALILGFLFFFQINKFIYKIITLVVIIGISILVFIVAKGRIDFFMEYYINRQMQSSGALLRIFLNIIPAIFLIGYRKKWNSKYKDYSFWKAFIYMSIFSLFLAIGFNLTTVSDRLLLYYYPFQIVVYPRILNISEDVISKGFVLLFVIFLYLAVLFVWLLFADHKYAWIPYNNFLLMSILRE